MSLFNEFIENAIKERLFIDISRADFGDDVLLGVIVQASDDFLCLKQYNENGEYDGLVVMRRADVTFIGSGGNERSSIEKLTQGQITPELDQELDLTSLLNAIKSISSKFGYVSLFEEAHDEEFIMGEVLDIDDEFVMLYAYGTKKALDRYKILQSLSTITRIDVDGKYDKAVLKSFKHKTS